MEAVTVESQFLPSVEYFATLKQYRRVFIDSQSKFQKKSCLNRCFILTSQGKHRITVPLNKNSKSKGIGTIMIDYSMSWQKNLWRTIVSAYGKSPFFEYYGDELKSKIFCGEKYICNFNRIFLAMCLKWLNMEKEIIYETKEMAGVFLVKNGENGISRQYRQVFGTNFVPNLSVIDLIFCQGPESYKYL